MGGSTAGNGRPPRRQSQSRGAGRKKEPMVATPPRRRRESRGAGRARAPKTTPSHRRREGQGTGQARKSKGTPPLRRRESRGAERWVGAKRAAREIALKQRNAEDIFSLFISSSSPPQAEIHALRLAVAECLASLPENLLPLS